MKRYSPRSDMEAKGLVERRIYGEALRRAEYALTETGYSLKPILDATWTGVNSEKTAQPGAALSFRFDAGLFT